MGIIGGLGIPELLIIGAIILVFFFGAPKVKEWFDTFFKAKKEATDIVSEKK